VPKPNYRKNVIITANLLLFSRLIKGYRIRRFVLPNPPD
jgi:hypothetical protein